MWAESRVTRVTRGNDVGELLAGRNLEETVIGRKNTAKEPLCRLLLFLWPWWFPASFCLEDDWKPRSATGITGLCNSLIGKRFNIEQRTPHSHGANEGSVASSWRYRERGPDPVADPASQGCGRYA